MNYYYNLPMLFSNVCQQNKRNIAIRFSDKTYSYDQINSDSTKLASVLLSQGLKRGDVVAIINTKEYLSYILMLACIKIGVIYTNVDSESPPDRFRHIIDISKPSRVFSDHQCLDVLMQVSLDCGFSIEMISHLFTHESVVKYEEIEIISSLIDGDAIAYIMFTSGSTGKPKGVAISHQNILHFICWSITCYKIKSEDVIANVNPMFFDNSVFDFYSSIFSGASLVPIKKSIVSSAKSLVEYIDIMNCTIFFSVPSLFIFLTTMRVLTDKSFSKMRVITFGGEGYPKNELKKIYDLFSSRIKFINVYGPTECTCICSSYEISENDFQDLNGLPPLGSINQNFSFIIKNEKGEHDVDGELCLLGPNVGRGYYNNLEGTQKAFLEYTGSGHYRSKMYCTGDIVSLRNNKLIFVGRKDNQIKHMGYRIELEEIELAIGLVPGVVQAAVLYQKSNTTYGKIVAYVAANQEVNAEVIRSFVARCLPSYMIPNSIILLEQLPKNQNGKVDKSALVDGMVCS